MLSTRPRQCRRNAAPLRPHHGKQRPLYWPFGWFVRPLLCPYVSVRVRTCPYVSVRVRMVSVWCPYGVLLYVRCMSVVCPSYVRFCCTSPQAADTTNHPPQVELARKRRPVVVVGAGGRKQEREGVRVTAGKLAPTGPGGCLKITTAIARRGSRLAGYLAATLASGESVAMCSRPAPPRPRRRHIHPPSATAPLAIISRRAATGPPSVHPPRRSCRRAPGPLPTSPACGGCCPGSMPKTRISEFRKRLAELPDCQRGRAVLFHQGIERVVVHLRLRH